MKWKVKPKTKYDKIKKRFALFPTVVDDMWFWLETYYSITEETYSGSLVFRFSTYQDVVDFIDSATEVGD